MAKRSRNQNARKEAQDRGDVHYFTGLPCVVGHVSKRRTSTGVCIECDKESGRIYQANNREKATERQFRWRQNNLEHARNRNRKYDLYRNYGITEQAYNSLLEKQNNQCAGCEKAFIKTPHVDHCHASGQVRGLLCGCCNRFLGSVKDNSETISNMINYLSETN